MKFKVLKGAKVHLGKVYDIDISSARISTVTDNITGLKSYILIHGYIELNGKYYQVSMYEKSGITTATLERVDAKGRIKFEEIGII